MAITVKDVAARAEVSVGTVSRVLNHDPTVRPVTRRAVEHAIAELGYTPNRAAQNLRRNRTGVVGLLLPDFRSAPLFRAVAGVDEVVHGAGLELLVSSAEQDSTTEMARAESMLAQGIDGLVHLPLSSDSRVRRVAAEHGVPTVLLTNFRGVESNSVVIADWRPALAEVMADLVAFGHEHVALVAEANGGALAQGRRSELRAAARASKSRKLRVSEVPVVDPRELASKLRAALTGPDAPTVLVFSGEALSIAALGAVISLGIRVPRHVSVVLFGLSDWSQLVTPRMASVGADLWAMGKRGAEMLVERMRAGGTGGVAIEPAVHVRGESIGPAATAPLNFFD